MPPFCPSPPDSGASPRVAQIWAIASVVNRHDEFRMTHDEAGGPAVWREVPIFTLGRYAEREGRSLLPVAVQVHHAVADGFHTARLIEELRGLFSDATWLRA